MKSRIWQRKVKSQKSKSKSKSKSKHWLWPTVKSNRVRRLQKWYIWKLERKWNLLVYNSWFLDKNLLKIKYWIYYKSENQISELKSNRYQISKHWLWPTVKSNRVRRLQKWYIWKLERKSEFIRFTINYWKSNIRKSPKWIPRRKSSNWPVKWNPNLEIYMSLEI